MKKLIVFIFSVVLLGSCSKIGNGIPNNLEGHWVCEPQFTTNTGTSPDKVLVILKDGTTNISDSGGWSWVGSISVDNSVIVFQGVKNGGTEVVGLSWNYSFSSGDLVLESIIDDWGADMFGTYEKQ